MKRRENSQQITKRIVARASKAGIKKAAANAMELMGYNVVTRDGWVIKEFKGGNLERITEIHATRK